MLARRAGRRARSRSSARWTSSRGPSAWIPWSCACAITPTRIPPRAGRGRASTCGSATGSAPRASDGTSGRRSPGVARGWPADRLGDGHVRVSHPPQRGLGPRAASRRRHPPRRDGQPGPRHGDLYHPHPDRRRRAGDVARPRQRAPRRHTAAREPVIGGLPDRSQRRLRRARGGLRAPCPTGAPGRRRRREPPPRRARRRRLRRGRTDLRLPRLRQG
jgi:hypothetical protein